MIPVMETASNRDPKDVADNKDLAALGYVWVLSLVVLFAKRESPFVQFHARQGAVLFGLSLVVWAMPFIGKIAELLILALSIVGFLHAAQGEWRDVPVIGPLSRGSFGEIRSSWKDVVAAMTSLWARVRPPAGTQAAPKAESTQQQSPPPAQPQPQTPSAMPPVTQQQTTAAVTESPVPDAPPPPESEVPPPAHP